jgi:hypothetical protein
MIDIPLDIPIKFVSAIDLSTTFIDQSNQEVVYKNISTKIYPSYLVGLQGWDYDRSPSGTKPYTLQGKVLEFDQDRGDVFDNYKNIKNGQIQLLLYYKDFAITQEK